MTNHLLVLISNQAELQQIIFHRFNSKKLPKIIKLIKHLSNNLNKCKYFLNKMQKII